MSRLDGGYLLPLLKGRAGEAAPTFAVELVYLQRTPAWTEKGEARVELPSVDLPVSRTGLAVNYSPRFQVEPKTGVFRAEARQEPWSAALRSNEGTAAAPPPPPPAAAQAAGDREAASAKALVDRFRKDLGRTSTGVIPVHVTVPDVGPSFFVAAELTAEAYAPALDVQYKRLSQR